MRRFIATRLPVAALGLILPCLSGFGCGGQEAETGTNVEMSPQEIEQFDLEDSSNEQADNTGTAY